MTRLPFNMTRTILAVLLPALICLGTLALTSPSCHALTDEQQSQLSQAKNAIKNAAADLKAARSSAGTADNPAKGSRIRLTKMRLSSASQRLGQAKEILGKLPADDDDVKPVQQDCDTVAKGIEEVTAIINPPADTKKDEAKAEDDEDKADTAPAEQAEQAPKLDYKQEDLLKNARWYLRETNGYADKAAAVVARMDADQGPKPVHREVRDALELTNTGKQKYDLAMGYIDQLPEGHPQVKPVADEIKQAGDKLGAIASRLTAANTVLAKLTDMANYPNYDKDFTLLQDLGRRYTQFDITVQQPEKLASIIKEDPQVMSELQRIAKTYIPLVEQKTPEGERIEKLFNHFMATRTKFATDLTAYKEQLPERFEADLKEATDLANEGVEKQNAMYFGPESGIEQRFGWAEKKLLVLRAFGEEEAKPYDQRMAEIREQIKQQAKTLEAQIIAANTLPSDNYAGEDRNAVIAMAIDGWKVQQPDAEILTARIPSQAWSRETRWEWFNGSFYKVDKSTLQVQLLVKYDDKLAVKRPLNVRMDHLKGDTMIAVPLDSIDDELIPQRYILLEKVQ